MIQLPLVFSDHMMLQQGKPVRIFGTAAASAAIHVCLADLDGKTEAECSTTAAEDGYFQAVLPPLAAGLDKILTVTDGESSARIIDVAVGEVWLAGGQSNMEYLMNTDAELNRERAGLAGLSPEDLRSIRFFDYPEIAWEGMEKAVNLSNFGKWRCLDEENIVYFSAVSYYFERKLREGISSPIAVIGCNWGGTKACCWIPEETIREAGAEVWITEYKEALKSVPDLDAAVEASRKGPQNVLSDPANPTPFDEILYPGLSWKKQEEAAKMFPQGEMPPILPTHPWRPAGLYHTMLKNLMPYTLRGFLWYQGCSDEAHPELYTALMNALIQKWRSDFEDPTLPFLTVQLAPFYRWLGNEADNFPAIRAAQERTTDEVHDTWMASIGDAGMYNDIHPKHKRKPGERLGLLALGHVYGQDILCDAPRAERMTYDGDTAVISFRNSRGLSLTTPENGGLTPEEAKAASFADPDVPERLSPEENLLSLLTVSPEGTIHAEIRDGTLRISLSADGRAVRPEHVTFACTPYYEVNVKNAAGLPVFPFRM